MEKAIKSGDLVKAISGRDAENYFVVIEVKQDRALIVDGRTRKINYPKRKNVKHLKKVLSEEFLDFLLKIQKGEPVSNKKLQREIKIAKQKIQED